MDLSPGQNAPVTGDEVVVAVTGAVDLTALVLSSDGLVSGDEDMVFFNQPTAPGVTLDGATLRVRLADLRPGAERVALVASPEAEDATFAQVGDVSIGITHDGGEESFRPAPQGTETALVLCELYLRQGAWKVRAVGQGFDTGLAGVAKEYGIEVEEQAAAPSPPPPPPPPAPSINLQKAPIGQVSLTKNSEARIPMTKEDKGTLRLRASLRWEGRQKGGQSDLDLYALFIDESDVEQAVYYNDRGSLTGAPWLQLDQDSLGAGEENIVLLAGRHRYVLFCAYSAVGNGAGSFFSYRAHVVVDDGQGSQVTVPLFNKAKFSYWVAIALLDFTDPSGVRVAQVEKYGKNFSEKRPVLSPDGQVMMSAGIVEFKGKDGQVKNKK